jgi:hypothetical protein
MGGNVTGINKKTGEAIKADKIDLVKADRQEFIKKFTAMFKQINKLYKKKFKEPLWVKESRLDTNELYNGSTSYIFDQKISDKELLTHKKSAGDLDIIVPVSTKENLWTLLDELEGKEIVPGIKYHGSNKPTISSIGEQINTLFVAQFGDYKALAQVDFEFLSVDADGKPNEIAKFGHSSSFEDAKNKVKAVHHKYLIRAMSGSLDVRENIGIMTKSGKISKAKGSDVARMLKFDLNKGISVAYDRVMDEETGKPLVIDGKDIYREVPAKDRSHAATVKEMVKLCFNVNPEDVDETKFWSFIGILELIKKYIKDKKVINNIHSRYLELLYATKGQPGQVLEVGNPTLDYEVKIGGYDKFCDELKLKKNEKAIKAYYEAFETLRGGKLTVEGTDILTFGNFLSERGI